MATSTDYAARLSVDYPEELDRITTLFRLILVLPILVILILITGSGSTTTVVDETGQVIEHAVTGSGGLFVATMLMIVFRQRYPRWWFDFMREMSRFSARIMAYLLLLTDLYPSTEEEQAIHLEIDYPDAENDINRWLPLVKWFLAIPHYVVLAILALATLVAIVLAWFAILFTGRYPRPLFDFVVGVGRYALRVSAYAFLLVTDRYPPFHLR